MGEAVLVVALFLVAVAPWRPAPWRPAPWRALGLGPGVGSGSGPARGVLASDAPRPPLDPAVVIELAEAALGAGTSIPGTLVALGESVGGSDGRALRRAGSVLLLGGGWGEAWAGAPSSVASLAEALEPAWVDGVPAAALLRRAADRVRAAHSQETQEAAARLGVRLVLPLGLCFLPAFVLLGLVPVVVATSVGLFG